ncbi:MAG: hypothetical protein E4G97_01065 [Deltaproteobacteria bacterium]|nr:MAG: hypothetical protein E4G97_01065 [Deltaproteobacteria bacterium]
MIREVEAGPGPLTAVKDPGPVLLKIELSWCCVLTCHHPRGSHHLRHDHQRCHQEGPRAINVFNEYKLDTSCGAIRAIAQSEISQGFSLRETFEAVHVAEVLVADAKESQRLAEERFANGAGTILDLIDAQVSMTRAEAKVVEATPSHQSACSRFLLVTGSL